MNNFTLRMISIICGVSFGIFMVSYNHITIYMFFLSIFTISFAEYGYALYMGKKIDKNQLILLYILHLIALWAGYWILVLLIPLLISNYTSVIFKENYKIGIYENEVINYFTLGFLWIYPSMQLCIKYAMLDTYLVIYLMSLVWISDGMAFCIGKYYGQIKFTSVSPNKTIEGSIAGILSSVLLAYFISYFSNILLLNDLLILGLLYGIFGQIGDLLESAFKRWVGVKDSNISILTLPGHGGLGLDRFDSQFIAIPIGHLYLMYRGY